MSEQGNTESLLGGYRVLDLADEKGLLCAKILGDVGADVIKIERPGRDPARNTQPFYKDIPHPEKSLFWLFTNLNKRGITLNLETADGRENACVGCGLEAEVDGCHRRFELDGGSARERS